MNIVPYVSVNGFLFGSTQEDVRKQSGLEYSESKVEMAFLVEYRDYYERTEQLHIFDQDRKLIAVEFLEPEFPINGLPCSMLKFDTIMAFFQSNYDVEHSEEGDFFVKVLGVSVFPPIFPKTLGCILTVVSSSYLDRRIPTENEIIAFFLGEESD